MALESLLDDAFRRGCGISRTYALRTPRYRELVETAPRVPNTTQAETAEMMYLGERLADRAFANLPYRIRKRAEAWPELSDLDRISALNLLMSRLKTRRWMKIHHVSEPGTKTVSEVLPAEYGGWSRGKSQPNCLGMTQMLVGFARATGADHLMVDVTTQHDRFIEEMLEQTTRQMIDLLKPHDSVPSIRHIVRKLTFYHEQALRTLVTMEKDRQAHHALLIKVGDDWYLVDPYLGRKYIVGALASKRRDFYGAIMKAPRRRWLVYGSVGLKRDCSSSVYALEAVMDYFARREEPTSGFMLTNALFSACGELMWLGVDSHRGKRPTKVAMEQAYWRAIAAAVATGPEQKVWKSGEPPKWVDESMQRRFERIGRNKRERNAALARLIRYICLTGIQLPFYASRSRKTEHRRIEVAHPTLHLAAMTLNHIAHRTDRPASQLLRFDTSQWILHDTLKEVRSSEDKRLKRIAGSTLRQLEKHPHQVMPALLAEIHKTRK